MHAWQILLGIVVVAFLLQMVVPGFADLFILDPGNLLPWMFISSCFLHGGVSHLFFNSFTLLMFGPRLERELGSRNFILLFIAAGLVGNITYYATVVAGIIPPVPALGASGGIYGILGALAILRPRMRVFLYFFPLPIRWAAVIWFVLEFVGAFNPASGIASAAHLGGLLVGLVLGMRHKKEREPGVVGYPEFQVGTGRQDYF